MRAWLEFSRSSALFASLGALCLAVSVLIISVHPHPTSDAASEESPVAVPRDRTHARRFDPAMSAAIIDRPLFHPERLMRVAEAPAPIERAPIPPSVRLAGFINLPGRERAALLLSTSTAESTEVRVGDTILDWTVEELDRGAVRLRQGDSTVTIDATGIRVNDEQ